MAGEPLASLSPSFVIGQPRCIKLYFDMSIMHETQKFTSIQFLDDLISSTAANAVIAHDAGFDLHLLSILKENDNKNYNREMTEAILELLKNLDLDKEYKTIQSNLKSSEINNSVKVKKLVRRLEAVK